VSVAGSNRPFGSVAGLSSLKPGQSHSALLVQRPPDGVSSRPITEWRNGLGGSHSGSRRERRDGLAAGVSTVAEEPIVGQDPDRQLAQELPGRRRNDRPRRGSSRRLRTGSYAVLLARGFSQKISSWLPSDDEMAARVPRLSARHKQRDHAERSGPLVDHVAGDDQHALRRPTSPDPGVTAALVSSLAAAVRGETDGSRGQSPTANTSWAVPTGRPRDV